MIGAEALRNRGVKQRRAAVCGGAALLLAVAGCGGVHRNQININSARAGVKSEAASATQVLASLKADITNNEQSIPRIININYADQKTLATLPGISMKQARIIMDNRPYDTPLDLLYKHVVTKAEYQRIQGRVDAWDNLWATTN